MIARSFAVSAKSIPWAASFSSPGSKTVSFIGVLSVRFAYATLSCLPPSSLASSWFAGTLASLSPGNRRSVLINGGIILSFDYGGGRPSITFFAMAETLKGPSAW